MRSCEEIKTLVACMGFCFLFPLSFSTTGLFLIDLAPHYGTGNKAVTWIAACQTGIGNAFGLLSGIWIKKLGPRVVGGIMTTLAVVGLFTGPLVDNLFFLYISYGLMFGIGSSSGSLVAYTTLFKTFPKHQPIMGGILATVISAGGFIWAPLTELLIEEFTWKGALMILSGVHLHGYVFFLLIKNPPSDAENTGKDDGIVDDTSTLGSKLPGSRKQNKQCIYMTPKEQPLSDKTDPTNKAGLIDIQAQKALIEKPIAIHDDQSIHSQTVNVRGPGGPNWKITTVLFLIASMFTVACHMNFYTYIPMLNKQNGFSPQKGAFLLSIVNICSGVVRLPAGALGNVKRLSCSLIYSVSVLGAAALSITSLLCKSYEAMIAMCAFYGLCAGGYMSLQSPSLLEQTNREYLTLVMGLQMTVQGLSIFILHATAGFILDLVGDGNVLFFIYGSLGLLSGTIVLSLVVTKVVYRLQHKKLTDLTDKAVL